MESALARLRAKTDRELCVLIARQLRRSCQLAHRGANLDATKDYLSAMSLLAVAKVSSADRARLECLMYAVRRSIELPQTAVA